MRNLFGKYLGISLLLTAFTFAGCRMDDDSSYEIRTYSSFFLIQKPNGLRSIYRYQQDFHQLDSAWNLKANVPDAQLSDASMVDNRIWIASGPQNAILQVNPAYGSVQEKFSNLPLAPHYIAIGDKQILISDTAAGKVAFLKLRNGDVQEIQFEGKPGMCIYNSGKFYLQVNDSLVSIYDESALTTRATVSIGLRISSLVLNRYRAIIAMSADSMGTYQALITHSADYLAGNYAVLFSKFVPTPYFSKSFGTEYLADLEILDGNLINDSLIVLADSIADFEADFFEGTLFYTRGGDLVVKSISGLQLIDSLAFEGRFIKSFHQYAAD